MLNFWKKRVHADETAIVLGLGLVLAVNSFATQLSGIVSLSGFIGQVGVNEILWLWVVANAAVVGLSGLQSRLMDHPDRLHTVQRVALVFGVLFVALRILFFFETPDWLRYGWLYLVSDQQWLWFPVIFWVLAGDYFNVTRARQVFPILSAFGLVGELLGILTAALSPANGPGTPWLLALNAGLYVLAFVVLMRLRRTNGLRPAPTTKITPAAQEKHKNWREIYGFLKEIPAFRYVALGVLPVMLCDTVIEFHFLVSSAAAITDPADYQRFYSLYRLALTLSALVMQTGVSSKLLTRMALPVAMLIYPITLLGISGVFLLLPIFPISLFGIWLMKLVRDTIHSSARKTLFALIPDDYRGRVSLTVETLLVGLSTGGSSVALAAVVFTGVLSVPLTYLALSVACGGLAVGMGLKVRAVYDASLLNWRLKRKPARSNALDKIKAAL